MKVSFETPSVDVVNKHRDLHIKRAKVLFKDYYKHLKKDILSDGFININQYKDEFVNLLKIAYKRILTQNDNSLFNNIKTEDVNIKDITNLQFLKDESFNLSNQSIESTANERTNLMFDNLLEDIIQIKTNARNTVFQDISKLSNEISKIDNKLLALSFGLTAPFTNELKKKLNKQKESLQTQLNKRTENTDKYIDNIIEDEYDNKIIENKTNTQAQNEVDNFEGKSRQNEASVLTKISGLLIGEEVLKPKEIHYKEWQNPLDSRSRSTHAEAHGQIVRINEKFAIRNPRTGAIEYTDRPQGEGLSPENSINCRCISREFFEFES